MFKKYEINENLFKTWTEESAYVLGWLLSDGHMQLIPKKKYSLRWELKDKEAILNIRKCLGSNAKVFERNTREGNIHYILVVNSKKMIKSLLDLGLTSQKAHNLVFPKIPSEHMHHFVRGFFEGDGSVQIAKRPKNQKQLISYFCSVSKPFLVKLGELLKTEIDLVPKIYKEQLSETSDFYKLRYGAKESYALYLYMYKGANYTLSRKKELFEKAHEIKAGIGLATCSRCKAEMVRTSNRTKWCGDCKKVVRREQWRESGARKRLRKKTIAGDD